MYKLTLLILICVLASTPNSSIAGKEESLRLKTIKPEATRKPPHPKKEKDLYRGYRAFLDFIKCQSHFNEKDPDTNTNLFACTDQYMSSDLPERIRRDYDQFLFSALTITEPFVCDAARTAVLKGFPNTPRLFLCFEVVDEKSRRQGSIFYKTEKDRVVITQIKFQSSTD